MNKYRFILAIEVEVESWDEADARDIIEDNFGPGEECGVNIKALAVEKVDSIGSDSSNPVVLSVLQG